MRHRPRVVLAAILLFVSFALTAQTPEFPKGTYIAHPPDDPAATIAVTYGADGKLTCTFNGDLIIEGKYVTKGDRIDYLDQTGPLACPAGQHGSYTWKADGKRILFKVIEDKCSERLLALTNNTWTRQDGNAYY